ncbi:MAG: energy transducer TonB [Bacteroidia bacterium]|nr:energy transducer TonB [Bacteroidia bacterium]
MKNRIQSTIFNLVILLFITPIPMSAQQKGGDVNNNTSGKHEVFTVVEHMPEFPGGMAELYAFINKNTQYPDTAKKTNTSGTVYVTFEISDAGKVLNAKILRGVNGPIGVYLNDEALRVVRLMPDWKPGTQNGKEVFVQYNLPIKFNLR